MTSRAAAETRETETRTPFGPLKQVDAGLLNVGYSEAGPAHGRAVILLHGWHYDIHSFVDVAPLLYSHRTIEGCIGHNLPEEAPGGFAEAIIDVDAY
jgi:hypothetical protein